MKYYVTGQTSIDKTTFPDGKVNGPYLGGTALFGYCGARVWTDNVAPIINAGADFYDYYGDWVRQNDVCCDHIRECYDETFVVDMLYQDNGYKEVILTLQGRIDNSFLYGVSNCRPEQLEEIDPAAKGVYMFFEPINKVFWKRVKKIKDAFGFKLMWEPSLMNGDKEFLKRITDIVAIVQPEMFTINNFEAGALFGTEDEDLLVDKVAAFDAPFIFYRCGKRGAYAISEQGRFFVPSIDIDNAEPVDPTGCGNASTAGAMVGWLETGNPVMAAVMGNISSGYTIRQFGLVPSFDEEQRVHAAGIAVQAYNALMQQHPEWRTILEPDGQKVLRNDTVVRGIV